LDPLTTPSGSTEVIKHFADILLAEDYRISEKQFVLFESQNPINMNTTIRRLCNLMLLTLCYSFSNSQDLPSFNQNSSRSNYTHGLSLTVAPVYSSATNNSKDSLLFRGTGSGFRVGGDYFFGTAGISFSTGFSSSSASDAAINNFLKNASVPPDQMQVTKAKQQNMYLLLGPSVHFGNKVELYAHAKGGLFINNSGLVNIQQRGAIRPAYRNESTDKNLYSGFLTGLGVQYKTKSDAWSFGIGADYMHTQSEVNNYDARRGNGIEPMKLSGTIQDIVAGISIRYNIFSPRDHASGQSTGRVLPTVNKREITSAREASSGMATGKRVLPTVNKREMAIGDPGMLANNQSCGPVTKKITNADGSTEEMTFSCTADALAYEKLTTTRQTPKQDFGEKMTAANTPNELKKTYPVPHILEKSGIISGTLTWATNGNTGIISNAVISNTSPRGGSTSMNSQSSSTRTTNQSSFGTMVRLSAREASSGMATGKRSREASSGLATGRRQYEPIFIEGRGSICNPCLADAKMSSAKNNPLYQDNGMSGNNPLHNDNKRTTSGDDDCDGVAGADIYLINAESNEVVAKTKTESCGDFFFTNVPQGNYVVRVSAVYASKKGYDVYLKSKTDVAGTISQSDDWMQLMINSSTEDNMQKAGISTSRSNLRTKSISIIEADLDGDGEFESLKAIGTFSDGTSGDMGNDARIESGSGGIVLDKSAFNTRRRAEVLKSNKQGDPNAKTITGIKLLTTASLSRAIATFSDGTSADVTESTAITNSGNVRQFNIVVADMDGDGAAEAVVKTKTKSNQSNDRVAAGDLDGDGIWSPRSNIKMIRVTAGDVNGDGTTDLNAGNMRTEFAVLRERNKTYFETGDIPVGQQSIVGGLMPGGPIVSGGDMIPGSPIGGLSIKGGKNPGGNFRTVQTNENGEFEFAGLEPGDYTFTIDQRLILDDETPVFVGDATVNNIVTSESNPKDMTSSKGDARITATQNSQSLRAQNNNTVRSNRTELKSVIIEADLDGDGEYESDISSKLSDEITIDSNGNIDPPAQQKAGVSTSRSNIRTRNGLVDKGDGLFVSYGKARINDKDVDVKIVYKVRHEMQMSAIRNLK